MYQLFKISFHNWYLIHAYVKNFQLIEKVNQLSEQSLLTTVVVTIASIYRNLRCCIHQLVLFEVDGLLH